MSEWTNIFKKFSSVQRIHCSNTCIASTREYSGSYGTCPHRPLATNSGTIFPDILRIFFTTVLSTKDSHNVTSNKVERVVESFGQDLMFVVSNGKFITPKYAAVGLGLHSLTGQKQPIKVLSHLGYSMTYDTVNEIETAQAELVEHFNSLNFNLPLQPAAEGCKVSISSNFVSCS